MKERECPKIEYGFRLGRLTVVSDTGERKNGYTVWLCACDCGGAIKLDTRTLQRGTVRDCGCVTKVKPGQRDLSGKRFGKLVALEPTGERSSKGATIWKCRCDCGNVTFSPSTQLTQGYKKSCGCLGHPPVQNLQGQQFGDLTAIESEGNRNGQYYWRCKCKCGNETVVRQNYLLIGKTKSCGCLQAKSITENLKLCEGTSITILQAMKNKRLSTNTSGYTGVYQIKRNGKWAAQITFKGKTYYLGSFEKIEDAIKARQRGEEIHDDFLKWYYEERNHSEGEQNIHSKKERHG